MLDRRKILLAITGSIAAYKAILLIRLLIKEGAEVKVVITPAAAAFVSPLVLETLSKNEVLSGLANESKWSNHVMLGRWADLMIVAPASCNTISKMAAGACDNLVLAIYLSATCPVWIAPAMDEDMWLHPATKQNILQLQLYKNRVLSVGNGDLASGLRGEGRMIEPEEIIEEMKLFFQPAKLLGVKALVTAGPTYEQIDPVRFIGNHSTGKMGIELAQSLAYAGAEITLVLGPVSLPVTDDIKVIRVQTAIEMFDACEQLFPTMDIAIMAAAVADYRSKNVASEKIKKETAALQIELVRNPDILKHCGALKNSNQLVVGFALETNDEEINAKAKLANKNADMIVLNSLNDKDSGFGTPTNKVTVFESNGNVHRLPLQSKRAVADAIVSIITKRWYENKEH